jgi:hypothetical protein
MYHFYNFHKCRENSVSYRSYIYSLVKIGSLEDLILRIYIRVDNMVHFGYFPMKFLLRNQNRKPFPLNFFRSLQKTRVVGLLGDSTPN